MSNFHKSISYINYFVHTTDLKLYVPLYHYYITLFNSYPIGNTVVKKLPDSQKSSELYKFSQLGAKHKSKRGNKFLF